MSNDSLLVVSILPVFLNILDKPVYLSAQHIIFRFYLLVDFIGDMPRGMDEVQMDFGFITGRLGVSQKPDEIVFILSSSIPFNDARGYSL
jgi:hypothetical protein